jgi:hypothetical protein
MVKFPNDTDGLLLLRSMKILRNMDEADPFLNWLETELERLRTENQTEIDPVTVRWRQGACMTLTNILTQLSTADVRLRAHRPS